MDKEKISAIEILDTDEAAGLPHIANSTFCNKAHARRIPFMKFGGKLLFKRDDLLEFLLEGKVKTVEESQRDTEKDVDHLFTKMYRKSRR